MTPRSRAVLIGSATLCAELGIDRSTLTRWVQAGKIEPAQRLPGKTGAMLWNGNAVEQGKALKREEATS